MSKTLSAPVTAVKAVRDVKSEELCKAAPDMAVIKILNNIESLLENNELRRKLKEDAAWRDSMSRSNTAANIFVGFAGGALASTLAILIFKLVA